MSLSEIISVLRQTRKDRKMKLEALCERLHLYPAYISKWENYKHTPSSPNLVAWASALGYEIILIKKDSQNV